MSSDGDESPSLGGRKSQYAANKLPKQECIVALRAPGKLANGDAPMERAKTTANAEFCIPVSIEMVLAVVSLRLKTRLGMV